MLSLPDGGLFPGHAYISIKLSLGLNLPPAAEEPRPAGSYLFFQVALGLLISLLLGHGLKAEFDSVSLGSNIDRGIVTESAPQFPRAYQLECGAEAVRTAILLSEKFVPLGLGIEYPELMDAVREAALLSPQGKYQVTTQPIDLTGDSLALGKQDLPWPD